MQVSSKSFDKEESKPIKGYTVKIISICGILGWEGRKLNRERKAKRRREHSTVLKLLFAIDVEVSLFSVQIKTH